MPPLLGKTMIIGIDVYHKTVQKINSVMGLVSTMNDDFSSYYTKTLI